MTIRPRWLQCTTFDNAPANKSANILDAVQHMCISRRGRP